MGLPFALGFDMVLGRWRIVARGYGMQVQAMSVWEHRETAVRFLGEADDYFRLGDDLQGAEKMWGAAAHGVIAVCQQRGWGHRSHRAMNNAVLRLAAEIRAAGNADAADLLINGFALAANCHTHFYHRDLDLDGGDGWFFSTAKRTVERFVGQMVAMSEGLDC